MICLPVKHSITQVATWLHQKVQAWRSTYTEAISLQPELEESHAKAFSAVCNLGEEWIHCIESRRLKDNICWSFLSCEAESKINYPIPEHVGFSGNWDWIISILWLIIWCSATKWTLGKQTRNHMFLNTWEQILSYLLSLKSESESSSLVYWHERPWQGSNKWPMESAQTHSIVHDLLLPIQKFNTFWTRE